MESKRRYDRPLSRTVLLGCAAFCVFLCFIMGVLGAVNYYRGMMGKFESYMEGILRYAMTEIDGDDLALCMETGRKSAQYEQTQQVLDRIKETHEIEYIYIVKPLNTNDRDNMMDVMAGATDYERQYEPDTLPTLCALTRNAYSPEVAAKYLASLEHNGDEITYFSNRTEFGHDYTALTPISDSTGAHIAVLAVDISVNEIWNVLEGYGVVILLGMAVLVGIFLTALYRWLGKRVIAPISGIQKAAEQFVLSSHGQSDPEQIQFEDPGIQSGDEIQALSESLLTMSSDLKHYMKNLLSETREKERIGTELSLAAKIQADMLPCIFPAFPDRKDFEIFATMTPAKEVGGDFYDFFMVDKTHLAVVMADVSGKGVPAALFMVIGKTLIKDHTQPGASLGQVFADVNNMLCASNSEGLFITAFEGVLDLETGEFRYVNAGHEVPYLCKKGEGYEPYKIRPGFVLAGMEDMRFKEGTVQLTAGDKLFLYTDGVPEATNGNNELYGSSRLHRTLNRNADADPETLLKAVKADVDAFVGEAPQFDDLTMLCLEYRGSAGKEDK